MKAIKGNKVYTISIKEKDAYLKQGYDVIDDAGNKTISPATNITVAEHKKKVEEAVKSKDAEIEELKAKLAAKDAEIEELKAGNEDEITISPDMPVEDLKAYAEEHGIDIGGAQAAKGIYDKIRAFEKANK
ncbi:MAG: hypothetical protein ACK5LC_09780 [Coprobacillaceae bacterium]